MTAVSLRDLFAMFPAGPVYFVVLIRPDRSEVVQGEGLTSDDAMTLVEELTPFLRPGERLSIRDSLD